jgi:DNA polymerase I-like protein with 3'-5' exonuclease and polymerase domains
MLKPVVDWLDANTRDGQFIIQIYDSIMVMVRDEDVDKTLKFMMALMTDDSAVDGLVPLAADAKVGQSWDSLKKVKI